MSALGNRAVTGPMIAADILKLRRHRPTMAAAAALSVGVTALYLAVILGAARDLVLAFAVSRFQPGPAIGTRANPGSTNALNNLKLPMPAGVAILVVLAWVIGPAVAGAWRTRNRDA